MIAPEGAVAAPAAEEAPPEPATQEAAAEAVEPSSSKARRRLLSPRRRAPAPARARACACACAGRGRWQRRRREDVRLAGRGADRVRARRRRRSGVRHRPRRARDQEGHPRLRRVRRRPTAGTARAGGPGRACGARGTPRSSAGAARARSRPGRTPGTGTRCCGTAGGRAGRVLRADDGHAPRHRRAHAPLARHLRARDERDRGRHVPCGRDPQEAEGRVPEELRRQPDLPVLRRPRHRRDAARLPVDQRRAARRPDRDAQLRQPRLRGRARRRQGPDRPGGQARRGPEPARHGAGDLRHRRSAPATRSCFPTTSRAARSRSRTPAATAPSTARR